MKGIQLFDCVRYRQVVVCFGFDFVRPSNCLFKCHDTNRLLYLLQNYVLVQYKTKAVKLIKLQLFFAERSKSNNKE